MAPIPTNLRSIRDKQLLEISWPNGQKDELPYKLMRGECPCASCINEFTGVRTLDVTKIPDDILPAEISFAGNYALRVRWSDGHDTGIFTWENLERIAKVAAGA